MTKAKATTADIAVLKKLCHGFTMWVIAVGVAIRREGNDDTIQNALKAADVVMNTAIEIHEATS